MFLTQGEVAFKNKMGYSCQGSRSLATSKMPVDRLGVRAGTVGPLTCCKDPGGRGMKCLSPERFLSRKAVAPRLWRVEAHCGYHKTSECSALLPGKK